MKRILSITFLNFFISGGLRLAIPLLLLDRNVDLVEIGVVISVLPIVFLVVRLLMALVADSKGWNRFYIVTCRVLGEHAHFCYNRFQAERFVHDLNDVEQLGR